VELLAVGPAITAETVDVLTGGDVALVVNDWKMTGRAPDGTAIQQAGRSADVVRRQADGRWLVVVDKP
jgi:ketosteroid isomerase-like protein